MKEVASNGCALVRYPMIRMAKKSITRGRVESVFQKHALSDKLNVVMDTSNSRRVASHSVETTYENCPILSQR